MNNITSQDFSVNNDINKLMDSKQREVAMMAKEIAEKEWEIFEFNLFISSAGNKHLEDARKSVDWIKKQVKNKKIKLSKYEKLAERF